jgi:hypothetical protein
MKKISFLLLILYTLLTACNSVSPSPAPTSTLMPVPSSTATPVVIPTSTNLPKPTATEQLTSQEELEKLIPIDEPCVLYTDVGTPGARHVPAGTLVAKLQVRTTGKTETKTINMGKSGEPRVVLLLEVGCRGDDENGNVGKVGKPFWLILGGQDFGKDGSGLNPYWQADGGSFHSGTLEEIMSQINKGGRLLISVATKKGGDVTDLAWPSGAKNEVAQEAILTLDANKEQIEALIESSGVNTDNFILPTVSISFP